MQHVSACEIIHPSERRSAALFRAAIYGRGSGRSAGWTGTELHQQRAGVVAAATDSRAHASHSAAIRGAIVHRDRARPAIIAALIGGLSYALLLGCLRPRYYVSRARETKKERETRPKKRGKESREQHEERDTTGGELRAYAH